MDMVPEMKPEELDIEPPVFDPENSPPVDLLVVGSGPAGLAVARQVSESGLQVCVVDPSPRSVWPNNYGVWVDEFEAMGLTDCLDYIWPRAIVYLDDDKKKYLDRPYGRVNRMRLKSKMMEQCVKNGVLFYQGKVDSVSHDRQRSMVRCQDGTCIDAWVILDATGFSRRLVQYDQPYDPGYQVAWGIIAEVESHPFQLDEMLFMDWRDSHLHSNPELRKSNEELPTFLYAMPFSPTRIFLEETSLVARPALKFSETQKRLEARLAHLGIKVKSIEEEEYCLIPMGGVLPSLPQRVLGIGGTAGMVHPSTGYMVARTLSAAPVIAQSIVSHLGSLKVPGRSPSPATPLSPPPHGAAAPSTNRSSPETAAAAAAAVATVAVATAGQGEAATSPSSPVRSSSLSGDQLSAAVWADVWPKERLEQREFFCFGMDVLLKLDLFGNRRFFSAFFDLAPHQWQGFLSSRLYFGELIVFGLSLFRHATNEARLEIMGKGIPGLLVLVKNMISLQNSHSSSTRK